jgi:hypothetical protein
MQLFISAAVFILNWRQPPHFYTSLISVWIVAYILYIPLSEATWSLCSNKPKFNSGNYNVAVCAM